MRTRIEQKKSAIARNARTDSTLYYIVSFPCHSTLFSFFALPLGETFLAHLCFSLCEGVSESHTSSPRRIRAHPPGLCGSCRRRSAWPSVLCDSERCPLLAIFFRRRPRVGSCPCFRPTGPGACCAHALPALPQTCAVFTRNSTAKPACGHSRSLLCGCNPSLNHTGAGSAHSVRAWACALHVCPDVCEVVTFLSLLCSVSLVLALPSPPPISSFAPISVSLNATHPRLLRRTPRLKRARRLIVARVRLVYPAGREGVWSYAGVFE